MKSILLILTTISTLSNAQVYFGTSGGYAFPFSKQIIATDFVVTASATAFAQFRGSLGKGINVGVFAGYKLGEHFCAEIEFENLWGAEIRSTFLEDSDPHNTTRIDRNAKAKMSRIIPGIRLQIGERKFKFYLKTGLVIGFNGEILSEKNNTYSSSWGTSYDVISRNYHGGSSIGISSGLGVEYKLGSFGVFCHVKANCQTWAPKKSSMTKREINGVDQLASIPFSYREYEYVDSYEDGNTGNDEPTKRLKEYYSFNSIGISLGLTYSFGKK